MSVIEMAQQVMARNPAIAALAHQGDREGCRALIERELHREGPAGWKPNQPKERSSAPYRMGLRAYVRSRRQS